MITALALLSPVFFKTRYAFFVTLISVFTSDVTLHFFAHIPLFGTWSLYTYSGWLMVTMLGLALQKNIMLSRVIFFAAFAPFLFWCWTNLGTWFTTALYPHNTAGLLQCYIAALPFLKNNVIATIIFCMLWKSFLPYCRGIARQHHRTHGIHVLVGHTTAR